MKKLFTYFLLMIIMFCLALTGCNTEAVKLHQTTDVEENETADGSDTIVKEMTKVLSTSITRAAFSKTSTTTIDDVKDAYQKYIDEKNYKRDSISWFTPADTYAIIDINQDGIPELIINVFEGTEEWGYALLYTYDTAANEVKLLEEIRYFGEEIQYSPKYKAIEYTASYPHDPLCSSDFCTVKDNTLVHLFSLVWDKSDSKEYHLVYNNIQKEITKEETQTYYEALTQIEFIPFHYPKTPDLLNYMGTDIDDFSQIIGGMSYDDEAVKCIGYTDYTVAAYANLNTKLINYLSIEDDCDYSIAGIKYGMSFLDAYELLKHAGLELQIDEPDFKRFQYKNGDQINIHAYDKEKVNLIFIYTADRWQDED